MIAKNIKGKSFKGCVRYVMHEGAELLEAEGVLAGTTEEIIRSFAMQRSGRKEIIQPVGHIPLSFAPEDRYRMTNEFMVQLAKEYMEEMGIKNTQYIIVRQHNADNDHLHIIYNRIDNDLKLISVNYDYKRNIKVCKKLKDKHGLTYGKGKERVKREKLRNPDSVKYLLHDIIKAILPYCTNEKEFQDYLQSKGINVEFKHRRTTGEIEGISFNYDNVSFKGSEIDRKFSYGNLQKEFEKNRLEAQQQKSLEQEREIEQARIREQKEEEKKLELERQRKEQEQLREQQEAKNVPPPKQNLVILGVELTDEQQDTLTNGGHTFLENLTSNDGKTQFSAYAFLNDEKSIVYFTDENPETFVKYGKYEMRLWDKALIEDCQITKATVKWWGGGSYAHPYLWKTNKSDTEYQESWGDPRIKKEEKQENTQRQIPKKQEKKRGRGI
jgi:hypothetical protein